MLVGLHERTPSKPCLGRGWDVELLMLGAQKNLRIYCAPGVRQLLNHISFIHHTGVTYGPGGPFHHFPLRVTTKRWRISGTSDSLLYRQNGDSVTPGNIKWANTGELPFLWPANSRLLIATVRRVCLFPTDQITRHWIALQPWKRVHKQRHTPVGLGGNVVSIKATKVGVPHSFTSGFSSLARVTFNIPR